MKKLLLIILLIFFTYSVYGYNSTSFTRLDYIGAEYISIGGAGEAIADDIFSLYWNPAGLVNLSGKKLTPEQNVREKAQEGDIDQISEEDLENFSKTVKKNFFQFGASGGYVDIDRNAAFSAFAFNIGKNVLALGFSGIYSPDIEKRDNNGNLIGSTNYAAGQGFLTYSHYLKESSIGINIKPLYQKIDTVSYAGGAIDIGYQTEFFNVLKVGFVLQDVGAGLYPYKSEENIEKNYDLSYPVIRIGAAIAPEKSNFNLCFSVVKKIERDEYELNWGVQYFLSNVIGFSIGMSDQKFTAGINAEVSVLEIAYAFAIDPVNSGYNHYLSMTMVL